jgi:hypothetical protein
MELWWNDIDRGKAKYREKNMPQCQLVYHKSPYRLTWDRTRASVNKRILTVGKRIKVVLNRVECKVKCIKRAMYVFKNIYN